MWRSRVWLRRHALKSKTKSIRGFLHSVPRVLCVRLIDLSLRRKRKTVHSRLYRPSEYYGALFLTSLPPAVPQIRESRIPAVPKKRQNQKPFPTKRWPTLVQIWVEPTAFTNVFAYFSIELDGRGRPIPERHLYGHFRYSKITIVFKKRFPNVIKNIVEMRTRVIILRAFTKQKKILKLFKN